MKDMEDSVIESTVADPMVSAEVDAPSADIVDASTEEAPKAKVVVHRDPFAKYKALPEEEQKSVDEIAELAISALKGDDGAVDLPKLLALIEKLTAEKKSAKEAAEAKAKEQKKANEQIAVARGAKLRSHVKEKDTISWHMSTLGVTILNASVIKCTEKSARAEVTDNTDVLFKGKTIKASEVPGLKVGAKSVPFAKIITLNGSTAEDVIAA